MKKFYVLAALSVAGLAFSQNAISFEASEGFTLGDINGQNAWTVTESGNSFIKNQVISNEQASNGVFSFKNAYESSFGPQYMPILGAEKTFASPLDYKNTTISYDFRANLQGESDFEFAVYAIDEVNEAFDTLFAIGFENRGYVYLFTEKNFEGFVYADPTWSVNKWYNMKIVISENKITYFLDGVQIHDGPNNSKMNIVGMNMLHNNYGGDAYYDNFKINGVDLATYEAQHSAGLKIYPNPAKDIVTIDTKEKIDFYSIYNMTGQKVLSGSNAKEINIQSLTKGNYILQVKTKDNKTQSTKLVKN